MKTMKFGLLLIVLVIAALTTTLAQAAVYGVKTCGSGSIACTGSTVLNVNGGGSLPPSLLFSFNENGTGLTDLGFIQNSAGADLDIDALAFSGSTLYGYDLTKSTTTDGFGNIIAITTASQLVSISLISAVATSIGTSYTNKDMRGAAFDTAGNMWTVDSAAGQLLRVDPATGNILSSVNLSQSVSTAVDIAFAADGTAYLSDLTTIFTLNTATGDLTQVITDSGRAYAGLAFSDGAPADTLFGYEVNGLEDINIIDVNTSVISSLLVGLFPNINGQFNAGRGDLAAHVTSPIPLPAAFPLFAGGLGLLSLFGRRRKRLASV